MTKVMMICSSYGPPWNEGVRNMVRVLEEQLADFQIGSVICARDGGRERSFEQPVRRFLPWNPIRNLFFWWRAAREARKQCVDAIHLFSGVSPILGLKCRIIRTFSGVPLLLHVVGLEYTVFGYRFLLSADRVIVVGSYLREFFPGAYDLPPISPHMNSQTDAEPRQLVSSLPPTRILYLGALEPVRGVHTLVDAAASLKTTFGLGGFTVTIAWNGYGDAGYAQEIRERIEKHNIIEHFRWEQSVDDPGSLYREHDLVVIPRASTARMGFPLRLIEAMSYGKPLVVSDIGEMPRIVKDCGLVFDHEDVTGLANALSILITDLDFYHRCAENARSRALEFDASRTVATVVEHYRELIHGG